MAEEQESVQQSPPPEKKRGWCCTGCLIVGLLLLFAVLGAIIYLYHTARTRATAADPAEIPEMQLSDAQREEAREKLETVSQAMHNGEVETVTLTPADLNAMIAREAQDDGEQGKLVVDIIDDKLVMDFSVPLKKFPGLSGRYVNGSMVARMSVTNGILELYPEAMQLNDRPLPTWLMDSLRNRNVANWIYENPNARDALKKIETLKLEDGKMIIETSGN